MEKVGEDREEEELRSTTATIRCAKAAILLSSLATAANSSTTTIPQLQDEEKIGKLEMELAKEKQKMKKLKHWIGLSLLSYLLAILIFAVVYNPL